MRIDQVIRNVKHWMDRYDYVGNLESGSIEAGGRYVKFEARTTKTRASSMVNRIEHIVVDVVKDGRLFQVTKSLVGAPPAERQDLATWSIEVFFPTRAVKEAA